MSASLPLARVIELSAIYYLSVFLFEVPSGYFSDRVGRRYTLLLAAAALVAGHGCFLVGGSFAWFAAGQILLAAGIAMQSGTDTALLYDSLKALGREGEYARREAAAEQWGMSMLTFATLSGGVLGLLDLRLAYVFSLCSAILMGFCVWRFAEPAAVDEGGGLPVGFYHVVRGCLARLRDPVLGWLFVYVILLYAMAHIVFEFYQPYISLLHLEWLDASIYAPLISGIVISISMFGGALGARASIAWSARLGLLGLLGLALFIQLGIVAAMAVVIAPTVLALVSLRNFPMSLVIAPVRSAIAPRIERGQRATYLSLQGLAERLAFALLLLALASAIDSGAPVEAATLAGVLVKTLVIGIGAALLLFLLSGRMRAGLAGGN